MNKKEAEERVEALVVLSQVLTALVVAALMGFGTHSVYIFSAIFIVYLDLQFSLRGMLRRLKSICEKLGVDTE